MRTILLVVLGILLVPSVLSIGLIAPEAGNGKVNQTKLLEFIVRGDGTSRNVRFFISGQATFNGTRSYLEVPSSFSGYEERRYLIAVVPERAGLLKLTWGVKVSPGAGVGMEEVIQDTLQIEVSGSSSGESGPGSGSGSGSVNVTVPVPSSGLSGSSKSGGGGGGGGWIPPASNDESDDPVVSDPVEQVVPQDGTVADVSAGGESGIAQGVVSEQGGVGEAPLFQEPVVTESVAMKKPGMGLAVGVVLLGLVALVIQVAFLKAWRREDA